MRLTGEILASLISACAVENLPTALIEGIISTESAGYVYALSGSYNYSDYFLLPKDKEEADYAIAVGRASMEHKVNISVGLMQINSWHMEKMGASIATTFDPCNNILIGTSIFKEITNRVCGASFSENCLNASLRQYNTGKTKPSTAGNQYVAKVRANMPS
ncbi:MAG: transglycosylase SLT domain-containing protein [Pseudomonadota bacterium]